MGGAGRGRGWVSEAAGRQKAQGRRKWGRPSIHKKHTHARRGAARRRAWRTCRYSMMVVEMRNSAVCSRGCQRSVMSATVMTVFSAIVANSVIECGAPSSVPARLPWPALYVQRCSGHTMLPPEVALPWLLTLPRPRRITA